MLHHRPQNQMTRFNGSVWLDSLQQCTTDVQVHIASTHYMLTLHTSETSGRLLPAFQAGLDGVSTATDRWHDRSAEASPT